MGVVYREGGIIGPGPALSAFSAPGRWRIDELGFRRTLGLWPEQIVTANLQQHFDAAIPESYSGSGTAVTDLSGNSRDGTLTNGVGYATDGGGTFTFDNVDDYILTSYNGPNSLNADNNGSWSVEAWFNFSAPASASSYYALVGRGGGNASAATFLLGIVGTSQWGGVTLQQNNLATVLRGAGTQITSASLSNTGWHQVVITWQASTARSYVDGAFVKNLSVGTAAIQAHVVTIGRTASGGSTNVSFRDRISNVKIYDTSLSAAEVLQNFNALRNRYGI
jgi:hypothetical protein